MATGLGEAELTLLDTLVKLERDAPDERFFAIRTMGGTWLQQGHSRREPLNDGALARLVAAGVILAQSFDNGGQVKSFYLAGSAKEILGAAHREAEAEAERERGHTEAQQATATRAPMSFGDALERMIALQKARPGGFFTPYDTNPRRSLGYSAAAGELIVLEHGEFVRLMTSGVLNQPNERLATYYLAPTAADILAAERRLQGSGPLVEAETRVAELEGRMRSGADARADFARRVGVAIRWVVLAVMLAVAP